MYSLTSALNLNDIIFGVLFELEKSCSQYPSPGSYTHRDCFDPDQNEIFKPSLALTSAKMVFV
jgi:hypothetical protein